MAARGARAASAAEEELDAPREKTGCRCWCCCCCRCCWFFGFSRPASSQKVLTAAAGAEAKAAEESDAADKEEASVQAEEEETEPESVPSPADERGGVAAAAPAPGDLLLGRGRCDDGGGGLLFSSRPVSALSAIVDARADATMPKSAYLARLCRSSLVSTRPLGATTKSSSSVIAGSEVLRMGRPALSRRRPSRRCAGGGGGCVISRCFSSTKFFTPLARRKGGSGEAENSFARERGATRCRDAEV